VDPLFSAPAGDPSSAKPPSRISNATIMGIGTVVVLFIGFVVVTAVACTWKTPVREIDLTRPLILTEEVGKKKNKKGKKDDSKAKKQVTDEVELVPTSLGEAHDRLQQTHELPPRVGPTVSPLATESRSNPTPPSSTESSPNDEIQASSSGEDTTTTSGSA